MWFIYALTFAILSSFSVIIAKRVMKNMDQYTYLLFSSIFTVPFLFILSIIFFKIPAFDAVFWKATIVGTAISVAGSILAYKAIRESELSLVNPISAFNPVFTAAISFAALGEKIDYKDWLGIIAVVVGAYALQISKSKNGFLDPFKALIKHKGVQLVFVAYLLWAITPTFEKTAILHTFPQNPPFAALVGQLFAIFIFIPIVIAKSAKPIESFGKNWVWFLLGGALSGAGIASAFTAYSLNSLGVTTAVFKLSLIFVPLLAWVFFRERNVKERLAGSIIMLVGVVLLVI